MEESFINLLQSITPPIEPETEWEQILELIKDEEPYKAIEDDQLKEQIFNFYIRSIQEACGHFHGPTKANSTTTSSSKKKKEKKKKKRKSEEVGKNFFWEIKKKYLFADKLCGFCLIFSGSVSNISDRILQGQ